MAKVALNTQNDLIKGITCQKNQLKLNFLLICIRYIPLSLTNKQILSSKGQNSKRNDRNRNIVVINNIMHIYILYPKYLQSFMQFRAVI